MAGYGKWLGGGLGWALGGPIGGIVGFVIGALYDNASEQDKEKLGGSRHQTGTGAGDFGMSLVVLSAAVMRADGKVMRSELDYVKEYFKQQFGAQRATELIKVLKEVLQHQIPLRQVCLQIRQNTTHAVRLQLLHYLFGIAFADKNVGNAEFSVLNTIARYLGISQKDFFSIHAMYGFRGSSYGYQSGSYASSKRSGMHLTEAYSILEIQSNVSDDEVKKAYRKMAKKFHPDRVASLGAEFQKAAKEKFQKVQAAYELIKDHRGMS